MRRVPLGPLDAFFLYADTPETPMHVAALMTFRPAEGTPSDVLRSLYEDARSLPVASPWNRRLLTHRIKNSPVHWWVTDEDVDLEYHVRRSALPSPGDERELGIMVARLHSNLMDLSRPPWELHLIEGLSDGRFAIYVKLHHALLDGVSAVRVLARAMSKSPDELDTPFFFSVPAGGGSSGPRSVTTQPGLGTALARAMSLPLEAATASWKVGRAFSRFATARLNDEPLVAPMQAPHSILNTRITRQRRFATQQYDIARLRSIGDATGTTLNDVALAICGGGLRTYLAELDALPRDPLIGFLPVNVRTSDDPGGGNAVGAVLSSLGTDIADPLERLRVVHASAAEAKGQLRGMDQGTAIAYSAALLAPSLLQIGAAAAGLPAPATTFNVCISNVPGPSRPLWFRGARMQALYPLSIPVHGMALNITLESYADTVGFGFIGCRNTLPHLQRLAVQTGEALSELEAAVAGQGEGLRRSS